MVDFTSKQSWLARVELIYQTIPMTHESKRLRFFFEHLLAETPIPSDNPYQQNPEPFWQLLFYPGLSRKPWFSPQEIPAIGQVEMLHSKIRAEVHRELQETLFTQYQEPWGDLFEDGNWLVAPFYRENKIVQETHDRFPVTGLFLQELHRHKPGFSTFSLLEPNTHILPHHGITNMRVRVQLGLAVPEGCALQVGKDKREMREGKAWAFDDSFLHEAWNPTNQSRLILTFDIWHPHLSEEEIVFLEQLSTLLASHPINKKWTQSFHGGSYTPLKTLPDF